MVFGGIPALTAFGLFCKGFASSAHAPPLHISLRLVVGALPPHATHPATQHRKPYAVAVLLRLIWACRLVVPHSTTHTNAHCFACGLLVASFPFTSVPHLLHYVSHSAPQGGTPHAPTHANASQRFPTLNPSLFHFFPTHRRTQHAH